MVGANPTVKTTGQTLVTIFGVSRPTAVLTVAIPTTESRSAVRNNRYFVNRLIHANSLVRYFSKEIFLMAKFRTSAEPCFQWILNYILPYKQINTE